MHSTPGLDTKLSVCSETSRSWKHTLLPITTAHFSRASWGPRTPLRSPPTLLQGLPYKSLQPSLSPRHFLIACFTITCRLASMTLLVNNFLYFLFFLKNLLYIPVAVPSLLSSESLPLTPLCSHLDSFLLCLGKGRYPMSINKTWLIELQ